VIRPFPSSVSTGPPLNAKADTKTHFPALPRTLSHASGTGQCSETKKDQWNQALRLDFSAFLRKKIVQNQALARGSETAL
jgi:hypothetical protein